MKEQNSEVRSQEPEEWRPDYSKAPQANSEFRIQNSELVPGPQSPVPDLLPLDAPERTARLRFGRALARHVFRPLTLDDWLEFLKAGRGELVIEGETTTTDSRESEAGLELWAKTIRRVEGYRVGDAWKEKIPPAHRLAAVDLLQEAFVLPAGDEALDLESETRAVRLEANWNEAVYSNLVHRFAPPAEDHQLKYSRLMSEFYRKRGRDRKVARITSPPKMKQLSALWDELIVSVEGYMAEQSSIANRQSAIRWMDPLHKQAAVLALFAGPEAGGGE